MPNQNIDLLLENQRLRKEFRILDLKLLDVWDETPGNLATENWQMKNLLGFTKKYLETESREEMESLGHHFPPISLGLSPDSDWYRFERWVQGKSVRETIKALLPEGFGLKHSEELPDSELKAELLRIRKALAAKEYYVDLQELPPRLLYETLLEYMEDEVELGGGWHLDGCTGFCPGCVQRPWCDNGLDICWDHDKKAGKVHLVDGLEKYVSPSPVSLEILQQRQVKHDRTSEEIRREIEEMDDEDLPF